jgi:hypothetical protein
MSDEGCRSAANKEPRTRNQEPAADDVGVPEAEPRTAAPRLFHHSDSRRPAAYFNLNSQLQLAAAGGLVPPKAKLLNTGHGALLEHDAFHLLGDVWMFLYHISFLTDILFQIIQLKRGVGVLL